MAKKITVDEALAGMRKINNQVRTVYETNALIDFDQAVKMLQELNDYTLVLDQYMSRGYKPTAWSGRTEEEINVNARSLTPSEINELYNPAHFYS